MGRSDKENFGGIFFSQTVLIKLRAQVDGQEVVMLPIMGLTKCGHN